MAITRSNPNVIFLGGDKTEINLEVDTNAGIMNIDTANVTHLNSSDATLDGTFTGTGNFVNMQSGGATAPAPGGAPAQTTVNVVFPTAFGSTPNVILTPDSASANLNVANIRWSVTNRTASGFTIQCWRDTNFSTLFQWFAHL